MKLAEPTTTVSDWMIEKAGYENWVEFCKRFGGQNWWIPTTPAIVQRDEEIRRLYNDLILTPGTKQTIILKKLSQKYKISIRTLRRVIS